MLFLLSPLELLPYGIISFSLGRDFAGYACYMLGLCQPKTKILPKFAET
jgi:hypothetical protein